MNKLSVNLLPSPFTRPERVQLSVERDALGPGPSDDRFYVIDPVTDKEPYNYPYLPPFQGRSHCHAIAPAELCQIALDDRRFAAAHLYGASRFVIEVWEKYIGRRVPWWFEDTYQRLELVTHASFRNAHCGYGFLETGFCGSGRTLFALNFDVIAHEIGHHVVYAEVGIPGDPEASEEDYLGFHEAISDVSALLSLLHFHTILDAVLQHTSGNLYTLNLISRVGKLTPVQKQIRVLANMLQMHDVAGVQDATIYGMPLAGMIYDAFATAFQVLLHRRGLIDDGLVSRAAVLTSVRNCQLQQEFDRAYRGNHASFRHTLIEARDLLGGWLAFVLRTVCADDLRYSGIVAAMLLADQEVTGGAFRDSIYTSAAWRCLLRGRGDGRPVTARRAQPPSLRADVARNANVVAWENVAGKHAKRVRHRAEHLEQPKGPRAGEHRKRDGE